MNIPIKALKEIADKYKQSQVIMFTWDRATGTTHCVTYGKTLEDCEQAAEGGNLLKRYLNTRGTNFTEEQCNAVPKRKLEDSDTEGVIKCDSI